MELSEEPVEKGATQIEANVPGTAGLWRELGSQSRPSILSSASNLFMHFKGSCFLRKSYPKSIITLKDQSWGCGSPSWVLA